jgi:predicted metal-dependent phosphoesterase TrpH
MTKVIIQPSGAALKELFAGADGEVELEIRQSIVEEFAKRHLKAIVNEPAYQAQVERLRIDLAAQYAREVQAQIGQTKRVWTGSSHANTVEFTPEMEAAFRQKVDQAARQLVDAMIQEQLGARLEEIAQDAINRALARVDHKINTGIAQLVTTEINRRLAAISEGLGQIQV